MDSNKVTISKISIIVAITAPAFPFLVPLLYEPSKDFFWINGPVFIWGLEFIAFIFGVIAWRTLSGKFGIAISLCVSILLAGYLNITSGVTTEVSNINQSIEIKK